MILPPLPPTPTVQVVLLAAESLIRRAIKRAINQVSDLRGTLGATQNRLDHTINNLSVMTENIQDAESTIRDTDVAAEMMAYTKNNILIQSAQAIVKQNSAYIVSFVRSLSRRIP